MIDIAQRAIERNSMIEIQIRETDEFIKLGQALKKPDLWNPVLMQNLSSRMVW